MSTLGPTLQSFFTDRLARQRHASSHTTAAYRDTFKLLLAFATATTGRAPSNLQTADLDAPMISRFLDHLETERGNSARTRNARVAAIRSLFSYAALRHPEDAAVIQRVLAILTKRFERAIVTYLTDPEIDALLAAPDQGTWTGRRDQALLTLAIQTCDGADDPDASRHAPGHRSARQLHRQRPQTADHAADQGHRHHAEELVQGPRRTPHRSTVSHPLRHRHHPRRARTASSQTRRDRRTVLPGPRREKISPHVLRHTAAMRLLNAGADTTVIALWLGHESVATTQIYVHADLALKERALARTTPLGSTPERYQPTDTIVAFLENL
jgi:integrase/recombinase XerD